MLINRKAGKPAGGWTKAPRIPRAGRSKIAVFKRARKSRGVSQEVLAALQRSARLSEAERRNISGTIKERFYKHFFARNNILKDRVGEKVAQQISERTAGFLLRVSMIDSSEGRRGAFLGFVNDLDWHILSELVKSEKLVSMIYGEIPKTHLELLNKAKDILETVNFIGSLKPKIIALERLKVFPYLLMTAAPRKRQFNLPETLAGLQILAEGFSPESIERLGQKLPSENRKDFLDNLNKFRTMANGLRTRNLKEQPLSIGEFREITAALQKAESILYSHLKGLIGEEAVEILGEINGELHRLTLGFD